MLKRIEEKDIKSAIIKAGNNLKNLSANTRDLSNTTVVAQKGIIDERKMILFNGQIISSKRKNYIFYKNKLTFLSYILYNFCYKIEYNHKNYISFFFDMTMLRGPGAPAVLRRGPWGANPAGKGGWRPRAS